MKYISQKEAQAIDKELIEKYKFPISSLIELAGLSVSHAIFECYKPSNFKNILVCVGPGNNGCDGMTEFTANLSSKCYDLIIDAIFGFSFKPPLRPPHESVIGALSSTEIPICSIDVPSGWFVDCENNETVMDKSICIIPEMIVCLSAPKFCIKSCKGKYVYLGGRFLPPLLVQQYGLDLPSFIDDKIIVKLDLK
ncbi:hypothetical protein MXB_1818 [Myxobolus squamalis]|nr:hypothetical protein MXB_1818 [Myxobolus squamalis]